MQQFGEGSLGGFPPEQLSGVQPTPLPAWEQNAIIPQAAQHLLTTAEGGESSENQLDSSLHLMNFDDQIR